MKHLNHRRACAIVSLLLVLVFMTTACSTSKEESRPINDERIVRQFLSHQEMLAEECTPEELEILDHLKLYFHPIADGKVPSDYRRAYETLYYGDDWVVRYECLYQLPDGSHTKVELRCGMPLSFAVIDCLNGVFCGNALNTLPDFGRFCEDSGWITFENKSSYEWEYYSWMVLSGNTPFGGN